MAATAKGRTGINDSLAIFPHNGIAAFNRWEFRMDKLRSLIHDESGATAIEYGLIAALISVAAIAAMTKVGTHLSTTFSTVASNLGR